MGGETSLPKAVALRYDPEKGGAPKIVASGQGEIATRIMELARDSGVVVTQDTELLEFLAQVPIGSEVPAELFQAVAEVLAFVYRLNNHEGQGLASDIAD